MAPPQLSQNGKLLGITLLGVRGEIHTVCGEFFLVRGGDVLIKINMCLSLLVTLYGRDGMSIIGLTENVCLL